MDEINPKRILSEKQWVRLNIIRNKVEDFSIGIIFALIVFFLSNLLTIQFLNLYIYPDLHIQWPDPLTPGINYFIITSIIFLYSPICIIIGIHYFFEFLLWFYGWKEETEEDTTISFRGNWITESKDKEGEE